jgi:CHASE3 domain sensor protein
MEVGIFVILLLVVFLGAVVFYTHTESSNNAIRTAQANMDLRNKVSVLEHNVGVLEQRIKALTEEDAEETNEGEQQEAG